MLIVESRFGKAVSSVCIFLVAQTCLPLGLATFAFGKEKKPLIKSAKQKAKSSRALTDAEMGKLSGRIEQNPYIAGGGKWGVSYKGVEVHTGNFQMSATDLTFESGYGIPVNVTRSYSSNNPDEGPFGIGWSLSADIRSTAGGILKSSAAPVRSVPTGFKERPSTLANDPNVQTSAQPVEAVVATDASGKEETIQKDVDGILSTPPWDKNVLSSQYEIVTSGGNTYQVLLSNSVQTPDGTVYCYEKKGYYTQGSVPFSVGSAAAPSSYVAEPSNILKITSATDRNGNITTYTYGDYVSYQKMNGPVSEAKLLNVEMPNGRTITFGWTNNRLTSATDGTRTVGYQYTNIGGYQCLTKVTTPGGKETSYGYSQPSNGGTGYYLSSITDPRNLTTSIGYCRVNLGNGFPPYFYGMDAVAVYRITAPSGLSTDYRAPSALPIGGSWPSNFTLGGSGGDVDGYCQDVYTYSGGYDVISRFRMGGALPEGSPEAPSHGSVYFMTDVVVEPNLSATLKWYSPFSQDLLAESNWYRSDAVATAKSHLPDRRFGAATTKSTAYNFMGSPLSVTTKTYSTTAVNSWTAGRTVTTDYAYWGASKYFQQKAVKDNAGRISYTDYFDSNATQGSKGQTKRVYSEAFTTFNNKNTSTWKYDIAPASEDAYSARFEYDLQGRPVNVWKLQKAPANDPWTYVQTTSVYGTVPNSGGAATQVIEDVGGFNRTTTTTEFNAYGKPTEVQDASGKVFDTSYDPDGNIISVYRTDNNLNQMVVQYTYGTDSAEIDYGMVTAVQDGLSGVTQSITYYDYDNGAATGQVAATSETNGNDSYSVGYTYNAYGDRQTSTYTTPNGTTRWGYYDYATVGMPGSPSRVFQTLNKLDANGNATSEEFHYSYDQSGKLLEAAFAQTPQTGQGYTSAYPAASRARAHYEYDAEGRIVNLEHRWDVLGTGGTYVSHTIVGNECFYDTTKGLKTLSRFWKTNPNNNLQFILDHEETFSYDANLDYLTSASYNDGMPNPTQSWSYDAAGNRKNVGDSDSAWQYNNLNMATTIGGVECENDILGNRTKMGPKYGNNWSKYYQWDALNRMTALTRVSTTIEYKYRADGMRVEKFAASAAPGQTTARYRYDGQMGIEDDDFNGDVTKYGLGARGIDYIEFTAASGGSGGGTTGVYYPIYDAHGNMVANIAKSGTNWYTPSNERSFDAWGNVRIGSSTGNPTGRYCASIGHKQDDESGLIYMRARYYEPTSGRFVSEDPGMEGTNWYIYCRNLPTTRIDPNGEESCEQAFAIALVTSFVEAIMSWSVAAIGTGGRLNTAQKLGWIVAALTVIGNGVISIILDSEGKILSKSQMRGQLIKAAVKGIFLGTMTGVLLATVFGAEAGRIFAEIVYIDNYELFI